MESAPAVAARSGAITETAGGVTATGGRIRIRIISAGIGSSGEYSPEVVAASAKLAPAGTHMHIDHPLATVAGEPRSVATLAAVTETDAVWDEETSSLWADARVFSDFAPRIAEIAEDIGVSIRGSAEYHDTPTGRVIDRLTAIDSIDFVSKAGRGGKILSVLESAGVIPRGSTVSEDMASTTDQALTAAVAATLDGSDDERMAWVVDHDPDERIVIYMTDEHTWQDSYTVTDDGTYTLDGDPIEVIRQITYVPVTQAGTDNEKGEAMPQISEARLAELTEAEVDAGKLRGLLDSATAELEAAKAELEAAKAELEAANVDKQVAEALVTVDRPVPVRARIGAALRAHTGEITDAVVEAAVKAEDDYLAAARTGHVDDSVRGFGRTSEAATARSDRTRNAWGRKVGA